MAKVCFDQVTDEKHSSGRNLYKRHFTVCDESQGIMQILISDWKTSICNVERLTTDIGLIGGRQQAPLVA